MIHWLSNRFNENRVARPGSFDRYPADSLPRPQPTRQEARPAIKLSLINHPKANHPRSRRPLISLLDRLQVKRDLLLPG